ncbi:MAG: hypothetical protein HYZ59_07685 [Actinobacteria bacterium]|nr:hypothetical protein [Actinomycetota bacterium]
MTSGDLADVFSGLVARPEAIGQLRAAATHPVHAYLLVGPPGRGSHDAAMAFAGALLCAEGGCGHCRTCRLALAGEHPDVSLFEPEGAFLLRSDAEEIIRVAARSPVEGDRKVLVLTDFHRVREVGPMLLKTIEEPPASTIFVIVADTVVPELVTIASRCVRVTFDPIPEDMLVSLLVGRGVVREKALAAAQAAAGDFTRASLLVGDEHLASRRSFWAQVPHRLDETGATVAVLTEEALTLVEEAAGPLRVAQEEALRRMEEHVATYGERGSGRRRLEATQRRELRRHRAEELRFGLAVLAGCYRDALAVGGSATSEALASLDAIQRSAENLVRNPSESLLLQALFLRLSPLGA